MGTQQYLIREGSEEVFELGKQSSGFHMVFPPREYVDLPDDLAGKLLHEAAQELWENPAALPGFCTEVAGWIRDWARGCRVMLVNEHYDDLLHGKEITGSRYGPEDAGRGFVFGQNDHLGF